MSSFFVNYFLEIKNIMEPPIKNLIKVSTVGDIYSKVILETG